MRVKIKINIINLYRLKNTINIFFKTFQRKENFLAIYKESGGLAFFCLFPWDDLLLKDWCLRAGPEGTESNVIPWLWRLPPWSPQLLPKASPTSSNERWQTGGINTANSQLDGTNLTQEKLPRLPATFPPGLSLPNLAHAPRQGKLLFPDQ